MLHLVQPPAQLYHPSVYEEELLTGSLIPQSVHTVTPPHTLEDPAREILINHMQETALFPGYGPIIADNEALLERTYCTTREEGTSTCEVAPLVRGRLHEACLLQHPSPGIQDKNLPAMSVTDNLNEYNRDWSPWVCYYFQVRGVSIST